MSTLSVGTIKSNTTSPPTIQNSSSTEVGTFCRAWVNFDGTGTVAIRASFNVSSITDNGTGNYTVNFTNALVDENYVANITAGRGSLLTMYCPQALSKTANGVQIQTFSSTNASTTTGLAQDVPVSDVSLFR